MSNKAFKSRPSTFNMKIMLHEWLDLNLEIRLELFRLSCTDTLGEGIQICKKVICSGLPFHFTILDSILCNWLKDGVEGKIF